MKVLICGSRDIKDLSLIGQAINESTLKVTEIISGDARGVDTLAIQYARANKLDLTVMPANWEGRGKSAGYHRNARMVAYADAVIAIWDGESPGTGNTVELAKRKEIPVYVKIVRSAPDATSEKILTQDLITDLTQPFENKDR